MSPSSIPVPTDNLYKFACLFGLALIISGIFAYAQIYTSSLDRKIKHSEAVIELESKPDRSKSDEDRLLLNRRLIDVTHSNEKFAYNAIAVVFAFGILLSAYGAVKWRRYVQTRDDRLAELQLQKLDLELALLRANLSETLKSNVDGLSGAAVKSRSNRFVGADTESALLRGTAEVVMGNPVEPLTAIALGRAVGDLTEEEVLAREKAGEFFSILRPGQRRGREYPAFQTWRGISGEPLAQVLEILRPHGGSAAYGFFTSPDRDLGGLTPIELLIGHMTNARELEGDAIKLLAGTSENRRDTVLVAAQAYAADLAA